MNPRFHWDAVLGWVVDTPVGLTPRQLAAGIAWVRRVQTDRIRAMPHGERREQATRALAALTVASVRQSIVPAHPWERDRILVDGG